VHELSELGKTRYVPHFDFQNPATTGAGFGRKLLHLLYNVCQKTKHHLTCTPARKYKLTEYRTLKSCNVGMLVQSAVTQSASYSQITQTVLLLLAVNSLYAVHCR